MFLVSADGRVIHFPIGEVNVLSGPGRGVMGIKLIKDDECIGGALVSSRFTNRSQYRRSRSRCRVARRTS